MKNGRVVASRYAMSLVVSVICLMMASCSGGKPIEVSDNDQSRFEELTKELRKKARRQGSVYKRPMRKGIPVCLANHFTSQYIRYSRIFL